MRVRLQDAPNQEDMELYDPHGIVILQVETLPRAGADVMDRVLEGLRQR